MKVVRYQKVKLDEAKKLYKKYGWPTIAPIRINGRLKIVYRWLLEEGNTIHYIDMRTYKALYRWRFGEEYKPLPLTTEPRRQSKRSRRKKKRRRR